MRILMVTSSYPKFPGDVTAPFIESIARGAAARGHHVDVVLPHHPQLRRGADEPVGFHAYRYAPLERWSLWGYAQSLESDVRVRKGIYALAPLVAHALRRTVGRRLRETRYDVVQAHWVVPNAAMVADIVEVQGVPLVVSLHGSDVFLAERLGPARLLAARTFATAGAVTACSTDLAIRAHGLGAVPERTTVVPYGVDATAFGGEARNSTTDWRARLGAGAGEMLVVTVGRLVEKKGFRHLIDAAARVPGIRVAIAGEGDLRKPLEAQIRESGAPVSLVGALERDDLAQAMAAADVLAVPSVVDRAGNVDGLPNTLLEAMAAGRAIVASRVAGIPDVVRDGVDGLLVAPGDADALAEALARLAGDATLRQDLATSASRAARERLSWEVAAERFEQACERAIRWRTDS